MSHERQQHRILDAIDSLVAHLVPASEQDDEETAQERHDGCFELAKSILENPDSPAIASDVNHASDLIKRKLIQTDPSKALRFSNLYSRLLSLPVLNQKWAILYLLYQLADSPDPNDVVLPLSPLRQPIRRGNLRLTEKPGTSKTASARGAEDDLVSEAFAPGGLKRFPPRDIRPSSRGDSESHAGAEEDMTSTAGRDVSIKYALLAENSAELDPPETALLRDLPFTLQGLSSTTLPFSKETSLKLPPTLPPPITSLLHTLAEPALLYKDLAAFIKSPARGLLGQSLRSAIEGELRSYSTLVATLEGQIRRALSSLDPAAPRGGIGKSGVTLKRCVVWTREATMGLRLLSLIAEESKSKRGGQLISLIHGFSSSHGDPVVAAFANRLLVPVTRPFYNILRQWIYDGELSDPYREFFVREQDAGAAADDDRDEQNGQQRKDSKLKSASASGGTSVWESKYLVDEAMIPSIMTHDFAQKVFLIGKSLNFIRHSCGDSAWVDTYSRNSSRELSYGGDSDQGGTPLEAWIDEAYKTTMRRLMQLMTTKFHVFEHLRALKRYILLGQGDFIALLMESLAANLDRPAGAQYRHTLTAQLEHAIRGSNAQYDDADVVLRRLDARMLQLSHGDMGWDCFTLEYKIDAPVDVVVTEWGARQYLKVFNFLWRIKRVEFALQSAWRRSATGARGVLQTADAAVRHTWKQTRGVLAEMVHFVGQLQYYILFEGLLGARRRQHQQPPAEPADAEDRNSYMVQLGELLRTMLAYRDCVDGLYSWAVSDFTRRQEADVRESTTTTTGSSSSNNNKRGKRPAADHNSSSLPDDHDGAAGSAGGMHSELPALQERLRHLGASFRARLQVLLGDLAHQPDVDLRFLGVAMNFNDVYQPVVTRRSAKGGAAAAGATATATAAAKTPATAAAGASTTTLGTV